MDGRRWTIGLRLGVDEKKCKEVDVRMGSSLISIFLFLEQKSVAERIEYFLKLFPHWEHKLALFISIFALK